MQLTTSQIKEVCFTVTGHPVTEGSGKIIHGQYIHANPNLKSWREQIAITAMQANHEFFKKYEPVEIDIVFTFIKPIKGQPKPTTRSSGDIDKLCRAVLDGLSQPTKYVQTPLLEDDAQVVRLNATKVYGQTESALIIVRSVS